MSILFNPFLSAVSASVPQGQRITALTLKLPSDGQPVGYYNKVPDFEDYGPGAFLLAESKVYKLSHLADSPPKADSTP
jgi:hypothetical protein